MRKILFVAGLLTACGVAAGETTEFFSDTFAGPALSSAWEIYDGAWNIENGALVNRGGGLITLKQSPGANFVMEAEVCWPENWLSVILFYTSPQSYGTLYIGGGYWESFEVEGEQISDYVQRADPNMRPGNFKKMKIVCEYGTISFYYDDALKGTARLQSRPGSRVGFRNLDGGGLFRIRNLRIYKNTPKAVKIAQSLGSGELRKSIIYKDSGRRGNATAEKLLVDDSNGAELRYKFTSGDIFESCFARIPVTVGSCSAIGMEVEGDASKNNFFIIIHDNSGEQHLLMRTPVEWQGREEVRINLESFLKSPKQFERYAGHWGGNENQKIDFPIKAVDVGIAKRDGRCKDDGRIKLRAICFVE